MACCLQLLAPLLLAATLLVAQSGAELRKFKNANLHLGTNNELTLNTDDNTVSFFVIGDWGGLPVFPFRTLIEQSVSDQLTALGVQHNTQFQLALGDNFYFNGVTDSHDVRFKETYENVFNSDHLMNTPWFITLGNHDHYGNADAQIEYMQRSNRWIFPYFNYTLEVTTNTTSGKQPFITVVMLDTILMCGNSGYDWQVEHKPRFQSKREQTLADSYFDALEDRLRRIAHAPADQQPLYLIVAGHFPIWSIAEHGPTKCLVDRLRPLLHNYNVSAYMCGHDHNMQHISDFYLNHRVEYIVSGASNFVDNSTAHINKIAPAQLKFHWADNSLVVNGAFCLVKATVNNMTITYIETTGKELYQTVIQPRPT